VKNKIIIPTILFIAVLFFSFFALSREKNKEQKSEEKAKSAQVQTESQIILFYGDGCPHCALVEKYIQENKIQDKVSFVQKEVYHNQNNAQELANKAKACGLSINSIGVPFLWDGTKCFIGDKDIINYFSTKLSPNSNKSN